MLLTTGVPLQCVNMVHIATYGSLPTHGCARRPVRRYEAEIKAKDVGEWVAKGKKEICGWLVEAGPVTLVTRISFLGGGCPSNLKSHFGLLRPYLLKIAATPTHRVMLS